MKSVRVITLGCSKNRVDTEHLLAQLPQDAFSILPEDSDAPVDYLLLNTCGFIGDAKEESIQAILQAVDCASRGIVKHIAVFGCLSQRYHKELKSEIPEVEAWFGARSLDELVKWLGARPNHDAGRFLTHPGSPYAYLKISEGCDRRCSYCAIPLIRGPHKSVPMEKLVEEASTLASSGVRELILIAQDSTYYGLDLYGRRVLAELLDRLSAIDGIEWIRIHYSYPDGFPDDVLERMSTNKKICKYLDIPLQHISDSVLSCMRRHVDGAWTRSLVRRLRDEVPGLVLRTTMIVGHPGETEKDFNELLDFVREVRFERLGAFTYSEEDGTYGASHYQDDVPPDEKQRRFDTLMSLQQEISADFNLSRTGQTEQVLIDDCVDGTFVCRSQYESPEVDGEILVKSDDRHSVGQFATVRIVSASEYDLFAEFVD